MRHFGHLLCIFLLDIFLQSCSSNEKKKEMYMPLPERISFSSFQYTDSTRQLSFDVNSKLPFSPRMNGLISLFLDSCGDSAYFDFNFDSCEISGHNLKINLGKPTVVNKGMKNVPDVFSELKAGKDGIKAVYLDLFHPDYKCYTYDQGRYSEFPFVSDAMGKDWHRKTGSDTLYILRSKTSAHLWDSIAHIVDPDCKVYCK
jgi:hypothetical protein